jgi:hypothetical protein
MQTGFLKLKYLKPMTVPLVIAVTKLSPFRDAMLGCLSPLPFP